MSSPGNAPEGEQVPPDTPEPPEAFKEKAEAIPTEVKAEAVPEKLRPRGPSGEEETKEKHASRVEQKSERKDNKVISSAKWQNLQNLQVK